MYIFNINFQIAKFFKTDIYIYIHVYMHLTNKPIRKDYQTLTWMNTFCLVKELLFCTSRKPQQQLQ